MLKYKFGRVLFQLFGRILTNAGLVGLPISIILLVLANLFDYPILAAASNFAPPLFALQVFLAGLVCHGISKGIIIVFYLRGHLDGHMPQPEGSTETPLRESEENAEGEQK